MALSINTQSGFAYSIRGDMHFLLGNLEGALSDFTKAIEINPNNSFARLKRGIVYDQKGVRTSYDQKGELTSAWLEYNRLNDQWIRQVSKQVIDFLSKNESERIDITTNHRMNSHYEYWSDGSYLFDHDIARKIFETLREMKRVHRDISDNYTNYLNNIYKVQLQKSAERYAREIYCIIQPCVHKHLEKLPYAKFETSEY